MIFLFYSPGLFSQATEFFHTFYTIVKNKKQPSIPSLDLPERQYLSFTDSSERLPLAMYVSEKQMTSKMVLTRFTITRSLCLRNAKTLRDSGEKSKADTWTLLAQVRVMLHTKDNILHLVTDPSF